MMAENVPGAVPAGTEIRTRTVGVPNGDVEVPTYMALPDREAGAPGIVVIHEAFGLVEHIRDVARRFAHLGYVAAAPDLYWREGGPDPANMDSVFEKMFGLPDATALSDLSAVVRHLRSGHGATGRVGSIGFCSGGRQSLLLACSDAGLDAAVDCWGGFVSRATKDASTTPQRPTPPLELADRLACPFFAAFGAEDQNPSPDDAAALESRLAEQPQETVVKIYPGAGHAFLADYRPTYRPGPAFALWEDVTAFLGRHLR